MPTKVAYVTYWQFKGGTCYFQISSLVRVNLSATPDTRGQLDPYSTVGAGCCPASMHHQRAELQHQLQLWLYDHHLHQSLGPLCRSAHFMTGSQRSEHAGSCEKCDTLICICLSHSAYRLQYSACVPILSVSLTVSVLRYSCLTLAQMADSSASHCNSIIIIVKPSTRLTGWWLCSAVRCQAERQCRRSRAGTAPRSVWMYWPASVTALVPGGKYCNDVLTARNWQRRQTANTSRWTWCGTDRPASRLLSLLCLGVRQHAVKDGVAPADSGRYVQPVTCALTALAQFHSVHTEQGSPGKQAATMTTTKVARSTLSLTITHSKLPTASWNPAKYTTLYYLATHSSKHGHESVCRLAVVGGRTTCLQGLLISYHADELNVSSWWRCPSCFFLCLPNTSSFFVCVTCPCSFLTKCHVNLFVNNTNTNNNNNTVVS